MWHHQNPFNMSVSTTINGLAYPIFTSTLEQLPVKNKTVINTINLYTYVVAEKDSVFRDALMNTDVLLPDGIGIVGASLFLSGRKIKKIAGADMHIHLLERLNKEGGSCFYLGSSEKTLLKIKEKLALEYPGIRAGFYSPPFKPHFSEADNADMIDAVNRFEPDILFVGLTAPKQEKWVHEHKDQVNAKIICSIGAAFDFYAGTINRPGKIWIDLGLEWMVRLFKEPRRMWKRTLYCGPIFFYSIVKLKVKSIISSSNQAERDLTTRKPISFNNQLSRRFARYLEINKKSSDLPDFGTVPGHVGDIGSYPSFHRNESYVKHTIQLEEQPLATPSLQDNGIYKIRKEKEQESTDQAERLVDGMDYA
jgi:N-acetylglucosaminyldiphosphoundecaprenol N-acetyl-beta-D-mannosaminyltransferase